MRTVLGGVGVAVLGLFAGFAGSVLAQRSPPAVPHRAAVEAPPPMAFGSPPSATPNRPTSQRLHDGPDPLAASAPDAGATIEPAQSRAWHLENDEKVERQMQANRLIAHAQEPRDANWAREMEGTLRTAFESLGPAAKVTYTELECRYISCKARLRWDDAQSAFEELGGIAALGNGLPCARMAVLDEALPGQKEVTGSVVIDCEQARLGPNESATK